MCQHFVQKFYIFLSMVLFNQNFFNKSGFGLYNDKYVTTVVTGKGEQLTSAEEWLWVPRSDVRNNDTRSKDPDLWGWLVIIPLYMSSPAHIQK